eukprot:TRINITY_DN4297_c0_g1_i2.p1 TRINITY_DN4297_c0_g1~~TRINITY_DN4297_c0_g1_i2.p1  ORF type:complete len:203 (-),score=39.31 TRINITY_DN4297_c0_g1_i2:781-1344(-)
MFSFSSAYFLSLSPLAGVALVTGALLVAKYLAPEVVVQGNQQTLVAFNVPPGRFPVRSQNPTNHVTSLNDWLPTSRVPFSVINENIRNFKEKAYRPTPEKGGIDMSTAIKEMQESVEIFGGHTLYDYYRLVDSFNKTEVRYYPSTCVATVHEDCLNVAIHMYNVTGATPLLLNFAQRSIDEVCGRSV